MLLYPPQNDAKVLVKLQKKSCDVRKTTNIRIGHGRQLEIRYHRFCLMVLEK